MLAWEKLVQRQISLFLTSLVKIIKNADMEVIVNDEVVELEKDSTIMDMFEELEIDDVSGMAIGVNGIVVKNDNWKDYKLKDNDEVLLIRATQGG